ncbi:MAG: ketose-bisphosphate aldolase [Clostridiales bacterium]|nr:ketose-bisphosphate aldolase [Clostridiales bacterium]
MSDMSLCTLADLLPQARKEGYAIGAFSVANMEMVNAVIEAAEIMNAPVILQLAQARLNGSPLHLMAPLMLSAAKNAAVPIAVHLDHGTSLDVIQQALRLGFTSVMYDGSALPLDQNIKNTLSVLHHAAQYGASVEAEIGAVGKTEDGKESAMSIAKEEDVFAFLHTVPVDAIAIAIGNAHGIYEAAPQLDFDLVSRLSKKTRMPFVFHGGTGITKQDFQQMIQLGFAKINIATASFLCMADAYEEKHVDLYEKMAFVQKQLTNTICGFIRDFGSDNKALKERKKKDAV